MAKKAATANKRKTKQTLIVIILCKPHGLFLRFIYRVCRLCQSFQSQQTVTKDK